MENKLLKALEGYGYCGACASPVNEDGASVVEKVLPLARQLVEDYKANEQNCAVSHVDESSYDALRERAVDLREENERLKTFNDTRVTALDDLQSRLSAAEAQRDSWKKHAEAIEGNLRVLGEHDIKPLKERLKRAEEVVEAAKEKGK